MILPDIPAEDVPAGTLRINGYAAERFHKTVDVRTNAPMDLSEYIVKNSRYMADDIVICRKDMTSDPYGNVTAIFAGVP